jgi:hypothetical protein
LLKNFIKIQKKRKQVSSRKSRYELLVWNMRYPNATAVDGTNVMWAGSGVGAK